MINGPVGNVGQLKRFHVKGKASLSWLCDCPDCQASHGKMFRVDKTVLATDPEHAISQAIRSLDYIYEDIEGDQGPDVSELPLGEDERMRMLNATPLPGLQE
jgi:hypothetical protein